MTRRYEDGAPDMSDCTESYDASVVDAATQAFAKATPGPWEIFADDDDVGGVVICQMWPKQWKVMRTHVHKPFPSTPDVYDNAAFIAGARDWVPRLVVMAKRLRDERDALRAQLADTP